MLGYNADITAGYVLKAINQGTSGRFSDFNFVKRLHKNKVYENQQQNSTPKESVCFN